MFLFKGIATTFTKEKQRVLETIKQAVATLW